MRKFPRAIPREKADSPKFMRCLVSRGWKRLALLWLFAFCSGFVVYLLFFYRIGSIVVRYTEESGKHCLHESEVVEAVGNGAIVDLVFGGGLRASLGRQFSCIEDIKLNWRGLRDVEVWVATTVPIIAVVKLGFEQSSVGEEEVFYVNKYGDVVRFQTSVSLPRVYLRYEGAEQGSSDKFLGTETLTKLLQLYEFFARESGSVPRIEVSYGGYVSVSTVDVSSLLMDLNGDLENQLRRYLYVFEYLRGRNQQVKQIDVRYKWIYVKSQE